MSDRILSLLSACITRYEISKLLNLPFNKISFSYEKNHKPKINSACHSEAKNVDFNFSHTKGAVLFGISNTHFVGVDIEQIQPPPFDIMEIAFHKNEKKFINDSPENLKAQKKTAVLELMHHLQV